MHVFHAKMLAGVVSLGLLLERTYTLIWVIPFKLKHFVGDGELEGGMGCDGVWGWGVQAARRGKGRGASIHADSIEARTIYTSQLITSFPILKVTTTNTTQPNSWGGGNKKKKKRKKKEDGGHRAKHSRQPTASTTALDLLYAVKVWRDICLKWRKMST